MPVLWPVANLRFLEELPSHRQRRYSPGPARGPGFPHSGRGPSHPAYLQADSSRPFVSGTDDTIGPLQKRAVSFFHGVCPSVGLLHRGRRGAAMAQSDEKGQARSIWYPTRQLGCCPGYKIWEPSANSPPPSVTLRIPRTPAMDLGGMISGKTLVAHEHLWPMGSFTSHSPGMFQARDWPATVLSVDSIETGVWPQSPLSPISYSILLAGQGLPCLGTPLSRCSHPCGEKWPSVGHSLPGTAKIPQILPLPPRVLCSPSSLKRKHLTSRLTVSAVSAISSRLAFVFLLDFRKGEPQPRGVVVFFSFRTRSPGFARCLSPPPSLGDHPVPVIRTRGCGQ